MPLHYFRTSGLPTSKCDFMSSFTVCDPAAVSRSGSARSGDGGGTAGPDEFCFATTVPADLGIE